MERKCYTSKFNFCSSINNKKKSKKFTNHKYVAFNFYIKFYLIYVEYDILLMFYFFFLTQPPKSGMYTLCLYSTPELWLTAFQVLIQHMWPVAAVQDSTVLSSLILIIHPPKYIDVFKVHVKVKVHTESKINKSTHLRIPVTIPNPLF